MERLIDEEIRAELALKYGQLPPETIEKLVISRQETQACTKRRIRCPRCHKILMETYLHDHELVIVKCSDCRFREPMDMAFFRRIRARSEKSAEEGVA